MDAAGWDVRYAKTDLLWTVEPNQFVVQETTELAAGRALDLGSGEGRNALWLAERGWEVTAVDFSQTAISRARSIAERRDVHVEWVCADVLEWSAPEDAPFYDLVLLSYLHFPRFDRTYLLQKAMMSLKPGGKLVVVGHDRSNLTDGVGGPQDPEILLDPDEVATELAVLSAQVADLVELRIDKAERVRRAVAVDGIERTAIDTLVTGVLILNRDWPNNGPNQPPQNPDQAASAPSSHLPGAE